MTLGDTANPIKLSKEILEDWTFYHFENNLGENFSVIKQIDNSIGLMYTKPYTTEELVWKEKWDTQNRRYDNEINLNEGLPFDVRKLWKNKPE
jgi:hypothetical protein